MAAIGTQDQSFLDGFLHQLVEANPNANELDINFVLSVVKAQLSTAADWLIGRDRVVPVAVEGVSGERIGRLDPFGIFCLVQFSAQCDAGLRGGRDDERDSLPMSKSR